MTVSDPGSREEGADRPPALSAHIGYLFASLPLEARCQAAREMGFRVVEHPAPFELSAHRFRQCLRDAGVTIAQMSSGTGAPGEKGLAALPGREAEFQHDFSVALDYAETVGCPLLHPMAGVGGDRATYLRNLERAVRLADGRGVTVLVESIGRETVADYHLGNPAELAPLCNTFGGTLKALLDVYHFQRAGVDAAVAIGELGTNLGHLHIADHPGRGEPGSGTIDFAPVLEAAARSGFAGAIGFEYIPTPQDHLEWLPDWQARIERLWPSTLEVKGQTSQGTDTP